MKLFTLGFLIAATFFSISQASVNSNGTVKLTWNIVEEGDGCSYAKSLAKSKLNPEFGATCSNKGEQVTLYWGTQGYECNPYIYATFECCEEGQCVTPPERQEQYP